MRENTLVVMAPFGASTTTPEAFNITLVKIILIYRVGAYLV